MSQINFKLILDSRPIPSPDTKWDLKIENRSERVMYVSTKMTGNHQGRFLCGNRKEQAVETEYFPRRPRILPATSRFPSHSSHFMPTRRMSLEETGQGSPSHPAQGVPLNVASSAPATARHPKVNTESSSLHLKRIRIEDSERRMYIHNAVINGH